MPTENIEGAESRHSPILNIPAMVAWATFLLILISVLGGGLNTELLPTFMRDVPSMELTTASLLGVLALGLFLNRSEPGSTGSHPQWWVIVCAVFVVVVSTVFLLFDPQFEPQDSPWRTPAPATSLTLLLLGIPLVLLQVDRSVGRFIAGLSLFACLLPLHRLLSYILGHADPHATRLFDSMSLPTALALILLASGLFLHPHLPYAGQLFAANLQGRLLRLALPWTALVPTVLSLVLTIGVSVDLYQADFVVFAVTAGLSVMMTVVLWQFTQHVQHTEDQRIAAQQTLQQNEAHANLIIDAAPDAIMVVDEQGRIQRINDRMEQLFGYTREEMLGQSVEMLIPERFRQGHAMSMKAYFSAPRTCYMGEGRDLFAKRKGGEEIAVEIGLAVLELPQGQQVLANVVDITERLRAQAQLEAALQEKTLLLNEIHHRVKNNLQIVASLLSLQAGRVGDARFSALIAESESRVQAMALMHQVLYERKDFTLVELDVYLERLAGLLAQIHGAGARGISVKLDAKPITLDLTRAIPLGLIVNELLCNAFKHAFEEDTGGEVRVELHGIDDGEASLVVRDNGRGLVGELVSIQANSLGMQIVDLLVEQIGGNLTANSTNGACFELHFTPCVEGQECLDSIDGKPKRVRRGALE